MLRTFNYPLYPTAVQETALIVALGACQRLYNAALAQRIDAYNKQRKNLSEFAQQKDLAELRKADTEFGCVATTILRSALSRLDLAYRAFYRRIKIGQNPGFPRFRSRDRYNSFSFPCQPKTRVIKDNLIRIPALGDIRFNNYRATQGVARTARVRRTPAGWIISIVCEVGPAPGKIEIKTSAGIDVGLTHFAVLSTGDQISNPRFYRKSEELLVNRQQNLATKEKGSKSRSQAKRLVARAHTRIKNQRLDFLRKLAKTLVTKYDLIAYESLTIKNMVRGNLAKSIHDASWGMFINCIKSKAEEAGKHAIGVNPRGTSQRCSRCAHVSAKPKTLADRVHFCESCGIYLDRDHNAAINVLALGLSAAKLISSEISTPEVLGVQR
jgi:putative transposase